jgi:hypothetical protein
MVFAVRARTARARAMRDARVALYAIRSIDSRAVARERER